MNAQEKKQKIYWRFFKKSLDNFFYLLYIIIKINKGKVGKGCERNIKNDGKYFEWKGE